nr:50S ribosomal protein L34e [Candidatus Njordarchaeota archaeon]
MPRPSLRMRAVKRKNLRTPGSKNVVHYSRSLKPRGARCSVCGAKLSGVPSLPALEMRNAPKSKKRPNRPYGGYLCPRCLAWRIRIKVWEETKPPEKAKVIK